MSFTTIGKVAISSRGRKWARVDSVKHPQTPTAKDRPADAGTQFVDSKLFLMVILESLGPADHELRRPVFNGLLA